MHIIYLLLKLIIEKIYMNFKKYKIYTQIHYIPIHTLPYYKNIGYEGADLLNSENYYSKCLSLPMFPSLKMKNKNLSFKKF